MTQTIEPTTLIPAQTAAVTIPVLFPVQQRFLEATIVATNLAGSETIPISFSVDNGVTIQAVSESGSIVELTEANNTIAIRSPLLLAVTKPVTAGAVGVFIFSNQQAR